MSFLERLPTAKAFPGPRYNDAMAGFLTCGFDALGRLPRSPLGDPVAYDLSFPLTVTGIAPDFHTASLLALVKEHHLCCLCCKSYALSTRKSPPAIQQARDCLWLKAALRSLCRACLGTALLSGASHQAVILIRAQSRHKPSARKVRKRAPLQSRQR